ncbi:MAG: response regulator transcription factor [Myxococcota bacterium]|nr:response regulator transcription factor [Myxococcota bacterium]
MAETILIIEDERDLVEVLTYNLESSGYTVRTALDGRSAIEQLERDPVPDLILLDLMLPDVSGIEICRRIRASERTRDALVLMLTAKGEEIDRVVGFEVGADDYVTKPFSVRELMLRVQAILKRRQKTAPPTDIIVYGVLQVDVPGHLVRVDELEISLTALEFKLLHTLLSRKGRVQTREMLLADVWEIHADITTRTVDTHVKRLREKLGAAGSYLETIRGVGYRFRAELNRDNEGSVG